MTSYKKGKQKQIKLVARPSQRPIVMEVGHEEGDDAESFAKSHVVCQYPTGHSVRPLETVLPLGHPRSGP